MPLSPTQLTRMRTQLKKVKDALKTAELDLRTARRAGLDVKIQEEDLKRMKLTIQGIERAYGPA